MKYEYYITNYLCQNISLVKIMLTMNTGKKWLKSRQYLEKKEFKALLKLHRHLYIFGFLIRQF